MFLQSLSHTPLAFRATAPFTQGSLFKRIAFIHFYSQKSQKIFKKLQKNLQKFEENLKFDC